MIEANVKFTQEHYKALYKNNKSMKFSIGFLSILGMVNAIAAVLQIVLGVVSFATMINIVFAALCIWYFVYMKAFAHKKALKNYIKKYPDAVIHLTFSEDSVTAEATGSGFSENVSYEYDKFAAAHEDKNFYLIYINKQAAYIIAKNEITEGTPEDLRKLLKEKLGKKFK